MARVSRTLLLNRRDWVYSLSLLIPLIVYNFALKVAIVWQHGPAPALELVRSDVFFSLGYALLWIGLLAAVHWGRARRAVVVLFHATTMLVVIITACAYQYFQHTGTTLSYRVFARWILWFEEEVKQMPFQGGASPLVWVLLAAALLYAALGPWLLIGAVERWRGWPGREPTVERTETYFLGLSGLFLLALAFFWLSMPIGSSPVGANASSLERAPLLNMVLLGAEQSNTEEDYYSKALRAGEHPATHARLTETLRTEKRNIVLIHLESARAQSVTPYNEDLATMPFLNELAKSSLLAERAHVVLPRSSKASVGVNCGIEPPLYRGPEFDPGGIPVPCLASLLKDQGYRTVFFASTNNTIDNFDAVVRGFGYEEIYSSEVMDREGFQVTNTFGYEEDIMLGPSEEWLKKNGYNEPFLAQYFTGTGHHGYECVPNRYGYEYFSEDEELDRYHNCLRMLDYFLENLFEQYKELGLYQDTIFVLYGDHGEGFREHGREMHDDTIWQEGLWVPLIVHAPGWFESGERVGELASQIDILPTVLDMLGYEVENGQYPGYSLLRPLPKDRTLNFSCISARKCLASLKGNEKYIHHYNNEPDELFDLSEDPTEEHNLASERSKEELDERRQRLFDWRTKVNAQYGKTYQ
jgi:lipoteichoic acid synthase